VATVVVGSVRPTAVGRQVTVRPMATVPPVATVRRMAAGPRATVPRMATARPVATVVVASVLRMATGPVASATAVSARRPASVRAVRVRAATRAMAAGRWGTVRPRTPVDPTMTALGDRRPPSGPRAVVPDGRPRRAAARIDLRPATVGPLPGAPVTSRVPVAATPRVRTVGRAATIDASRVLRRRSASSRPRSRTRSSSATSTARSVRVCAR